MKTFSNCFSEVKSVTGYGDYVESVGFLALAAAIVYGIDKVMTKPEKGTLLPKRQRPSLTKKVKVIK